ncbi:MAG: TonB-dependent receptor [Saprospiraceae bacterium]|nr:TonB-dependent receptor [Saprospiraceae bacterium]
MKYQWFPLFLFLLLFNTSSLSGQSFSGRILDQDTGNPLTNVEVNISDQAILTDVNGRFSITNDFPANIVLSINHEGYNQYNLEIENSDKEDLSLGIIFLKTSNAAVSSEFDDNAILDERRLQMLSDDNEVSSLLSAAWDPFGSLADYNFSVTRFNPRGLAQNHSLIYLNNLPFNNLSNGSFFWSLWGGLNDMFRNRYAQHGLNTTDYSVGGMAGAMDIDLRASSQWKQTRFTYSLSNRSYQHRAMLTHSSGLNKSGWSYALSVSRRWGNEGYVAGTHYDAYSYFASVDKKINDQHTLNAVLFAAPTVRGRGSASTQEMYDLTDDNFYNPNWGLQGGEVRNSREYRSHQPVFMLRHDFTLSDNTKIVTSAGIQTGKFGSTRLDWLEGADPRPDYYRNLPYANKDNPAAAEVIADAIANDELARQIDFDELIRINQQRQYLVIDPTGNSANNYYENISAYVIEEQRYDNDKLAFQSHLNHKVNDRITFNSGIQFIYDRNHQYRVLADLLGGSYYLDIDDFALRDFPDDYNIIQNDLSRPNRLLTEGDIYGYNHYIHNQNVNAWSSVNVVLPKVDLNFAASIQNTRFWREGLVQNGKFPDNSLGDSETESHLHGLLKAGMTYKINGRNYVYLNTSYMSRAPYSRYAFLSPQIRNDIIPGLTTEKIYGGEIGYVLRHPRINARLTGFYFNSADGINSVSFYHDEERSFVNYSITNIDKINYGLEFGVDFKLSQVMNLGIASALGEYYYNSRQNVTITQDNNADVLVEDRTVYLEGYNISGVPQIAHTVKLEYRSPNYWSVSINANYFDDIFIDPSPDRRTSAAVDGILKDEQPDLWNDVLGQEKFDSGFTVDLFIRKSFRFSDNFLYLSAGINNVLDNTDFKRGGYEQLRFDFEGKDTERFAPRYFYAYGRTYFLSIGYRL